MSIAALGTDLRGLAALRKYSALPDDPALRPLFKAIRQLLVHVPQGRVDRSKLRPLLPLFETLAPDQAFDAQLATLMDVLPAAASSACEDLAAELADEDIWRQVLTTSKPAQARIVWLFPDARELGSDDREKRILAGVHALARMVLAVCPNQGVEPEPDATTTSRSERVTNMFAPAQALFGHEQAADAVLRSLQHEAVTIVVGAGGIGKTTLVRSVAASAPAHFQIVWMVDCTSTAAITRDLLDLAARLNLVGADPQNATTVVLGHLSALEARTLLVLDGVRGPEALEDLVPGGNCSVLCTSRTPLGWNAYGARLTLTSPSADDAARIVLNRSGQEDRELALRLAAAAEYLPVALDHLGRVAEHEGLARVVALAEADAASNRFEQIPPAFSASLIRQMARLGIDNEGAFNQLVVAACLGSERIPRALFENRALDNGGELSAGHTPISAEASHLVTLVQHGFGELSPESLTLHPLVGRFIRSRDLGDHGARLAVTALQLLGRALARLPRTTSSMSLDLVGSVVRGHLGGAMDTARASLSDIERPDLSLVALQVISYIYVWGYVLGHLPLTLTLGGSMQFPFGNPSAVEPAHLQMFLAMAVLEGTRGVGSSGPAWLDELETEIGSHGPLVPDELACAIVESRGQLRIAVLRDGAVNKAASQVVQALETAYDRRTLLSMFVPSGDELRGSDPDVDQAAMEILTTSQDLVVAATYHECSEEAPEHLLEVIHRADERVIDKHSGLLRYQIFRLSQAAYEAMADEQPRVARGIWSCAVAITELLRSEMHTNALMLQGVRTGMVASDEFEA